MRLFRQIAISKGRINVRGLRSEQALRQPTFPPLRVLGGTSLSAHRLALLRLLPSFSSASSSSSPSISRWRRAGLLLLLEDGRGRFLREARRLLVSAAHLASPRRHGEREQARLFTGPCPMPHLVRREEGGLNIEKQVCR